MFQADRGVDPAIAMAIPAGIYLDTVRNGFLAICETHLRFVEFELRV